MKNERENKKERENKMKKIIEKSAYLFSRIPGLHLILVNLIFILQSSIFPPKALVEEIKNQEEEEWRKNLIISNILQAPF
jgi:hypothetical protein